MKHKIDFNPQPSVAARQAAPGAARLVGHKVDTDAFPPGRHRTSGSAVTFPVGTEEAPACDEDGDSSNQITVSVKVNASVAEVYEQWTQFGAFPHFMQGRELDDDQRLDESWMVWRIAYDGRDVAWEAEVTEQEPGKRIVWNNVKGRPCPNAGSVSFDAASHGATRVTVTIDFYLPERVGRVCDLLGALTSRVERNMVLFSEFIQCRPVVAG